MVIRFRGQSQSPCYACGAKGRSVRTWAMRLVFVTAQDLRLGTPSASLYSPVYENESLLRRKTAPPSSSLFCVPACTWSFVSRIIMTHHDSPLRLVSSTSQAVGADAGYLTSPQALTSLKERHHTGPCGITFCRLESLAKILANLSHWRRRIGRPESLKARW